MMSSTTWGGRWNGLIPVGDAHRRSRTIVSKTLSVDQAAKILGVKQQVAYALVHSGLIPTDRLQKPIQIGRDELETFQREYVSLAELARERRISSRRLLLELKVAPVSGPAIDGCRQYFFWRFDVAA